MTTLKIVLASDNVGKIKEFSASLSSLGVEITPQGKLGVESVSEPYITFVENALTKARHASKTTGLPSIADDSGLCVQALNGAPGVYSARYSQMTGGEKSDYANNMQLLVNMQNVTNKNACFVAVLVFLRSYDDPIPIISTGLWQGTILEEPMGDNGFGYDPVFFVPKLNQSAAQLTVEQKNKYSHRSKALNNLVLQMQNSGVI